MFSTILFSLILFSLILFSKFDIIYIIT
jgi:hypothetical protein